MALWTKGAQSTYSAPRQMCLSTHRNSSRKTAKEESASFNRKAMRWILGIGPMHNSHMEKQHMGLRNTSGNLGGTHAAWTLVSDWKSIKNRKGTLGWTGKLTEKVATAKPLDFTMYNPGKAWAMADCKKAAVLVVATPRFARRMEQQLPKTLLMNVQHKCY